MNNLVRLDAESSARLRMVRPGDRTSFIPSAREAGEFISRTDTLLRTQTITKPQKYLPPLLPLLHHFICYICFICYISI